MSAQVSQFFFFCFLSSLAKFKREKKNPALFYFLLPPPASDKNPGPLRLEDNTHRPLARARTLTHTHAELHASRPESELHAVRAENPVLDSRVSGALTEAPCLTSPAPDSKYRIQTRAVSQSPSASPPARETCRFSHSYKGS